MAAGGMIPEYPIKRSSGTLECPWVWAGVAAVDGAVGDWALAPLGSEYTKTLAASVTKYIKLAKTSATADWHSVTTS